MTFQTLIDASRLRTLLGDPGVAVVDCRFDLNIPEAGRRAFLEAHVPGARYADLNRDLSAPVTPQSGRHPLPAADAAAAVFTRLGIGTGIQVIAYDDSNGAIAARLWWMLRWLGHGDVAVLDGGFKAWLAVGGAVESGEARAFAAPAPFALDADPDAVLDASQVATALADSTRILVDARAAERYAGTLEPIDPVAGHVPRAVNHPFTANLAPDGRFLPREDLKQRWLSRLGGLAPAATIAMCGSGVTACHNLLALEIAGLPGAKLYAGSWSEWIRDPRRGVARGAAPG